MIQQNINEGFSKDIKSISEIKRFKQRHLNSLESLNISKKIFDKIKNIKKHDHLAPFNRDTVNPELLVKNNILLALKYARHYFEVTGARRLQICELDDVIQEGIIGLTKASYKYVKTSKEKFPGTFGQFAKLYIIKGVIEYIENGSRPIKVTGKQAYEGIFDELKFHSINGVYDNGKDTMQSQIFNEIVEDMDSDEIFEIKQKIELRDSINSKMFRNLEELEKTIILLFFGFNQDKSFTTQEISNKLNIPKKEIAYSYKKAINKIKLSGITQEEIAKYKTVSQIRMTKAEFSRMFENRISTNWKMEKLVDIKQNTELVNTISKFIKKEFLYPILNKNLQPFNSINLLDTKSKSISFKELSTLENLKINQTQKVY